MSVVIPGDNRVQYVLLQPSFTTHRILVGEPRTASALVYDSQNPRKIHRAEMNETLASRGKPNNAAGFRTAHPTICSNTAHNLNWYIT